MPRPHITLKVSEHTLLDRFELPTSSFQRSFSFSVRRSAYSHIIRARPGCMGSAGSAPAPADFQSAASTKLAYSPRDGAFLRQSHPFSYPPCTCRIIAFSRIEWSGKVWTRTKILLSLFLRCAPLLCHLSYFPITGLHRLAIIFSCLALHYHTPSYKVYTLV